MRLSQYAGMLDDILADTLDEYEIAFRAKQKEYLDTGLKDTPAETRAKIDMAETKGLLNRLEKLSSSAWKQVGTIQSRINHLNKEAGTNI